MSRLQRIASGILAKKLEKGMRVQIKPFGFTGLPPTWMNRNRPLFGIIQYLNEKKHKVGVNVTGPNGAQVNLELDPKLLHPDPPESLYHPL